jgi:hypothetical protein
VLLDGIGNPAGRRKVAWILDCRMGVKGEPWRGLGFAGHAVEGGVIPVLLQDHARLIGL